MTKITLSVTEDTRDKARRVAAREGTSVSSMFSRFVQAMAQHRRDDEIPIGPVTRSLSRIIKLPKGKTWEDVREEAMIEKHGPRK